jgi:hypothetical protein
VTEEEIRITFEEKVRRGIFRPVVRRIHGPDPEDRLAEAVGLVFEEYQRAARRGVVLEDAVLVHACRLRAMDLGRQLVKGGQRRRDVLDRRNRRDGRVEILHVDDELEGLHHDPTPDLIGALDVMAWAASLRPSDRTMIAARLQGYSLREVAQAAGVSTTFAFTRLRSLGAELARRSGRRRRSA